MKHSNKFAFILALAISLFSCKKDVNNQNENQKETIDLSKISKVPETVAEKDLVNNLGKITTIFKELYKNGTNVQYVNSSIFSKVYSDDALIRELNLNRDVFFILNRTNLEGEMKNGWPVRDKNGPVSYTLNDRTYF